MPLLPRSRYIKQRFLKKSPTVAKPLPRLRAAVAVIVAATLFAFGLSYIGGGDFAPGNALPSRGATVTVPILMPKESETFATYADLAAYRRSAMNSLPEALRMDYEPNELLFKGPREGAAWENRERYYIYGESKAYVPGVPAHAITLANPLLLIDFEFPTFSIRNKEGFAWSLWKLRPSSLTDDFPYRPLPEDLRVSPAEGRAEVTYQISAYLYATSKYTGKQPIAENARLLPIFLNANDFDYRSAALAPESLNVSAGSTNPQPVYSLIVPMAGPCGPKGCNALTGTSLPLTIKNLPAKAIFYLWKNRPSAIRRPDFVFQVNFR